MANWKGIAVAAAMATGLAACGGGGGDDDAGFRLSGSADGAAVKTVNDGQTTTLDIASGQELRFTSNHAVAWTATAEKTTITKKGESSSAWNAVLKSPEGGKVTLVARSQKDASKTATIVINVPAHRYHASAIKVGESITFRELGTSVNGGPVDRTYTQSVTAVDPVTRGATLQAVSSLSVVTDVYTQDSDRNRLTRAYVNNGNVCTYTPKRANQEHPLYVGKTWEASWQYSCTAGYRESTALKAVVEAFEQVTVGDTAYDALRIAYVARNTNSNDIQLPDGPAGVASYQTDYKCWWATDLGRVIKCTFDYTYPKGAPGTYQKSVTQMALAIKTVD